MDLAHWLRLPHSVHLWLVRKASDATDWGEGEKLGDEAPF